MVKCFVGLDENYETKRWFSCFIKIASKCIAMEQGRDIGTNRDLHWNEKFICKYGITNFNESIFI